MKPRIVTHRTMNQRIAVDLITESNAAAFKAVRLEALRESPTAFAGTYAGEATLSESEWLDRAAQCYGETSVGYLALDAETTCGIVLATPDDQDSAVVWLESLWVAPAKRRLGVGRLLVRQSIGLGSRPWNSHAEIGGNQQQ